MLWAVELGFAFAWIWCLMDGMRENWYFEAVELGHAAIAVDT